jgi:hypothetical protein
MGRGSLTSSVSDLLGELVDVGDESAPGAWEETELEKTLRETASWMVRLLQTALVLEDWDLVLECARMLVELHEVHRP